MNAKALAMVVAVFGALLWPRWVDAEELEIELYTMGPGDEILERYGHAALCARFVEDPERDRCFNYGTTDFDDLAVFAWDFVRGRARFWSSKSTVSKMLRSYEAADRTIWVQALPLSQEQAELVYERLVREARKETREYIYNHFEDNCTTRVRDILDDVTEGALSSGDPSGPGLSYRDITRQGLSGNPILVAASDLVFGRRLDRYPDRYQSMLLPRFLRAEVEGRLGSKPFLVYQRKAPLPLGNPVHGPWFMGLFLLLFVVLPAALACRKARARGKFVRGGFVLSYGVLGLVALIVWVSVIACSIPEFRYNELFLVLWPSDLLVPFLRSPWRDGYARFRMGWLATMLLMSLLRLFAQPMLLLIVACAASNAFLLLGTRAPHAGAKAI